MSAMVTTRRSMKKCARDASRRKSALTIDLNTPPPVAETLQPEAALTVSQETSTATEALMEVSTARMIASPIDVEAIEDDDVQMLPPPRAFPQRRRNQLRIRPMAVVLDEDLELTIGTSVINVDDHPYGPPLKNIRRHQRFSPDKTIINCETYVSIETDQSAKRRRTGSPLVIEPEKAAPREPVFSCPICMNALADACSTICGHVFCQVCIKQAVKSQKKCPTCRRKLTLSNFHRVFLPASS